MHYMNDVLTAINSLYHNGWRMVGQLT